MYPCGVSHRGGKEHFELEQLSLCLCASDCSICLYESAGLRMSKLNVLLPSALCKSHQCKYEHRTPSVDSSDAQHCSVEFSRSQPGAGSSSCRCDCSYDASSSDQGRKERNKKSLHLCSLFALIFISGLKEPQFGMQVQVLRSPSRSAQLQEGCGFESHSVAPCSPCVCLARTGRSHPQPNTCTSG